MTVDPDSISYELGCLSKLISFNTVNGNDEAHVSAADFLKKRLEELGCIVEMVDPYRDGKTDTPKPNVIGYMDFGKSETVSINCHYDIVPPGDGWDTNPFSMEIKEEKAYGRGANDDKGGIAITLGVLKKLKESGTSKYNIQVIFPCDEEVGGMLGTGYVLEKIGTDNLSMAIVLDSRKRAILGSSGTVRGTITVHGIQAHSGQEWAGKNAITEGIALLGEMNIYKKIRKNHTSALDLPEPTLPEGTKCFGRFNITVVNSGSAYNTIPGKLEAKFDMRLIPEETVDDAVHELEEFFESAIKITGVSGELRIDSSAPGYAVDQDNAYIRKFMKTAGFEKAYATSGSNDGRYYHERGVPTMVTGMQIARTHHKPNENISFDEIVETERMLTLFLSEA